MANFLANLLSEEIRVYHYYESKEIVKELMEDLFKESGGLLSALDFRARFTDPYTFTMNVPSSFFTRGMNYGSLLTGTIKDSGDGAIVETRVKSNFSYLFIVFVACIVGCGLLFEGIMQTSWKFVLYGLAVLTATPIVCNWFAGISNASVQDRYIRFVHKAIEHHV